MEKVLRTNDFRFLRQVHLFCINFPVCSVYNASIPGAELGLLVKKLDPSTTIKQQGIWITADLATHANKFTFKMTGCMKSGVPYSILLISKDEVHVQGRSSSVPAL